MTIVYIFCFCLGLVLFLSGCIALIFRQRILGSELAKQGGGLRSWITKRGISHGGGTHTVRSGAYIRGFDERGIPIMGETRSLVD